MKIRTLIIILVVVLLIGCGEMPLFRTGAPMGLITFAEGSPADRSLEQPTGKVSRALDVAADIQPYMNYYNNYGTLIGAYSPTVVRLPIGLGEISISTDTQIGGGHFLMQPSREQQPDPNRYQADFTEPIESGLSPIPPGNYRMLAIPFSSKHAVMFGGKVDFLFDRQPGYLHFIPSVVEVELPGYGGVLGDLVSDAGDFSEHVNARDVEIFRSNGIENPIEVDALLAENNADLFERKHLSGDLFRFSLFQLYPKANPADWQDYNESFLANTHAFIEGVNAVTMEGYDSGGSAPIYIPYEGLVIDGTSSVRLVLNFDFEDLVQVYDNGTAGDPSDDIVVIAPNYWERFSLKVIYE